jgi:hypothetical protein
MRLARSGYNDGNVDRLGHASFCQTNTFCQLNTDGILDWYVDNMVRLRTVATTKPTE